VNAEPSGPSSPQDDEEIVEALIKRCKLSHEDVANIHESMRTMGARFADAAVHLGLVTPGDIVDITAELMSRRAKRGASIIERVMMRGRPGSRELKVSRLGTVMPGPQLTIAHDPDCERSEQLRALRTDLMFLGDLRNQANLLAVLSPCSGEGRSQLAAELAIAFSQLGRRTLLVDADLRKPGQHLLFSAPNDWGLGQALSFGDRVSLYDVHGLPFLSMLPAGPTVPNPLELLSGNRLGPLIHTWRYHYDFVVIDTPPVSQYADALAMATLVRRVLIMGRQEVTQYKQMKGMLRRIAMTQSQVLGAVLNKF
jgi:protein-tyrosine kinase